MLSCSAVKSQGMEKESETFMVMLLVFPTRKQLYICLPIGSSEWIPCYIFLACAALPCISTHQFFLLLPFWSSLLSYQQWVSEWLGGDLPAGQSQPNIKVENPAVEGTTDHLGACIMWSEWRPKGGKGCEHLQQTATWEQGDKASFKIVSQ